MAKTTTTEWTATEAFTGNDVVRTTRKRRVVVNSEPAVALNVGHILDVAAALRAAGVPASLFVRPTATGDRISGLHVEWETDLEEPTR